MCENETRRSWNVCVLHSAVETKLRQCMLRHLPNMDLYLHSTQDSFSLQEMLDCDMKNEEMDGLMSGSDLSLSLSELPPLDLDEALGCGAGDLMWFSTGSASHALGSNGSNSLNLDLVGCGDPSPAAMMVNPTSVMPVTLVSVPSLPSPSPAPAAATIAPVPRPTPTPVVPQPQPTPRQLPVSFVRTLQANTTTARASTQHKTIRVTTTPATTLLNRSVLATTHRMAQPQTARPDGATDDDMRIYPKPAYSYSCLIAMALKNSQTGSLPVSEIYNFMCEHFPYFKTAPNGWKNSVRHNLSLNKCFEKIEKPAGNGSQRKGCLWAMNPAKIAKMDEEVQKWSRKDPVAIRKAMVCPDDLERLERGEMKRELRGSTQHFSSGGEESEGEEQEAVHIGPEYVDVESLVLASADDSLDFDIEVAEGVYDSEDGEVFRVASSSEDEEEIEDDIDEEELELATKRGRLNLQGNYLYKPVSVVTTSRRKAPLVLRAEPLHLEDS